MSLRSPGDTREREPGWLLAQLCSQSHLHRDRDKKSITEPFKSCKQQERICGSFQKLTGTSWAADTLVLDGIVTLRLRASMREVQYLSLVAQGPVAMIGAVWSPSLSVLVLFAVHDTLLAGGGLLDKVDLEAHWAALIGGNDRVVTAERLARLHSTEMLPVGTLACSAGVSLPRCSLLVVYTVHRAAGWWGVDTDSGEGRTYGAAFSIGSVLEAGWAPQGTSAGSSSTWITYHS